MITMIWFLKILTHWYLQCKFYTALNDKKLCRESSNKLVSAKAVCCLMLLKIQIFYPFALIKSSSIQDILKRLAQALNMFLNVRLTNHTFPTISWITSYNAKKVDSVFSWLFVFGNTMTEAASPNPTPRIALFIRPCVRHQKIPHQRYMLQGQGSWI